MMPLLVVEGVVVLLLLVEMLVFMLIVGLLLFVVVVVLVAPGITLTPDMLDCLFSYSFTNTNFVP